MTMMKFNDYWRSSSPYQIEQHTTRSSPTNKTDTIRLRNIREPSQFPAKECVDVFEIYGVNKDLFLKVLEDPNQKISSSKARFTKLGSFPMANFSPSTLQHKQNEAWSFLKGVTSVCRQSPKIDPSKQETSFSSQGSLHNLGWNQLITSYLKDIKKTIKQALKERKHKKGMSESSKTIATSLDVLKINKSPDSAHGYEFDHGMGPPQLVRRTVSLNESLDRYARLFEQSFSKDNKLNHCKSLILASEHKVSLKRASRFCRRISSLSDLESICSLLSEVSRDAERTSFDENDTVEDYSKNTERNSFSEQKLVRIPEETDKEEQKLVEVEKNSQIIETSDGYRSDRSDEEIAMTGDLSVFEIKEEIQETCLEKEEETSSLNPIEKTSVASLISVVKGCFHDDTINSAELPISAGSKLNSTYLHMDEQDCPSVKLHENSNTDSTPIPVNEDNFVDKMGDSSFIFVRDVLKLSGFIADEFPEKWHSVHHLLNPSLLKEMETKDKSGTHQQLLFDLINEALLRIYDRSYTYFPSAFSISFCTRPLPNGDHVVEKVWSMVKQCLDFKPRPEQSLDGIIAQDMENGDGWMKLHMESECVALDLEEFIFDELLDIHFRFYVKVDGLH